LQVPSEAHALPSHLLTATLPAESDQTDLERTGECTKKNPLIQTENLFVIILIGEAAQQSQVCIRPSM
jgi:hypothetical protein